MAKGKGNHPSKLISTTLQFRVNGGTGQTD